MVAIFTGLGAGLEPGSGAAVGAAGLLGSSSLGRGNESVFLNAATGNLVLSRQDEFLVGHGPDISVGRTYNSLGDTAHDDNGDLWRQSTDRRLLGATGTVNTVGAKVKRLSADGSLIEYEYDEWETGKYYYRATEGAGAHDKLVHTPAVTGPPPVDAYWTWTDGSTQHTEKFESDGAGGWRLKELIDSDGNKLTYTYTSGRLHRVTTDDGSYAEYTWDTTNNRVTSIVTGYQVASTSYTPTRTHYEYDSSDRLIKVSVDFTPHNDSISDNDTYWIQYTYDGSSQRVASIVQKDGSKLEISYHSTSHKVTSLTQWVATGDSRTTTIDYQSGYTNITDGRGSVWTLYYETSDPALANQLTEIKAPAAVSGAARISTFFDYDEFGNLTRVTDGEGEYTDYAYDDRGNAITITDANGNTTTRVYDGANNLLRETRTGSYQAGASTQLHTRFVYDDNNHLRFTINAEGEVTEHEYDDGRLVRTMVYTAAAQAYALGTTAPSIENMEDWRDAYADLAAASTTVFVYDGRGNLADTYRYGAASLTTGHGIGDGDDGTGAAGGFSRVHFDYDVHGRLLSRQTQTQQAETFVYDQLGRLTGAVDSAGGVTTITFTDGDGELGTATKTDVVVTLTTGFTYTTHSVFNKAGELVSKSDVDGANALMTQGGSTYDYDKNGQLRRMTDASGLKLYFVYDRMGRKVSEINQLGDMVEYRYDPAGRVFATVRHANRVSSTHLASLNSAPAWEIEVTESPSGGATSIRPGAHSNDLWQFSIYDDAGRLIETVLGDGSVTTYAYDTADRLIGMRSYANKLTSTQVNGLKAGPASAALTPTADSAKDAISRTFYDRAGRVIGALNGEGYLTQTVYDEAGRKIQQIAYAKVTDVGDRASGSFADLLDGLADANADISSRWIYDGQGLLRYAVDALDYVTEYIYWDSDGPEMAVGLVRKAVSYAAALTTALTSSDYSDAKTAIDGLSEPGARISYNVYNDRAQLAYTIDAAGAVTRVGYNALGLPTKITRFAATIDMSEQGAIESWHANLGTWSNTSGNSVGARVSRNYYNSRGELIYALDAENYLTRFEYDSTGRKTWERRYPNKITSTSITVSDSTSAADIHGATGKGVSRDTYTHYDAAGRVEYIVDPQHTFHLWGYLANGLVGWEIEGTWADNARTVYTTYDLAGRKTSEKRYTSELANSTALGAAATVINGAERIASPNGAYSATLTRDGEFELYHLGEKVWSSGSREAVWNATYRLDASSGALKIYRQVAGQPDFAIWTAFSGGSGASFLALDDEGELTLRSGTTSSPGANLWVAGTEGLAAIGSAGEFAETVYTYDGLGNLATVEDPNDVVTTFGYDRLGRLTSQSKAGVQTFIEYGAFGAVKHTDANGNHTFSYYDELGRVKLRVDAEKYAVETSYNAFGEVDETIVRYQKLSAAPTVATLPTVPTHALDAKTEYSYDNLGRVALVRDAEGYITKTAYTSFGEVAALTRFYNTSSTLAEPTAHTLDAETSFTYDLLGRVTATEDAAGGDELFQLNAFGERILVTNPLGGQTAYTYDGRGLVLTATRTVKLPPSTTGETIVDSFQYDSRGNLTKKIEAGGLRTTRYEYDKLDRLVRIIHDTQTAAIAATATAALTTATPTETFYYDRAGNLIEKRDAAGARTLYWYNGLGRVTHELRQQTATEGVLTHYTYDGNGNVLTKKVLANRIALPLNASVAAPSVTAAGRVTTYEYDGLNRLKSVTIPNIKTAEMGTSLAFTPDTADDLATLYEYDARNNVVKTTDPASRSVYSYYDRLNRKIAEIDGANYRTDWSYNGDGNVLEEKRYATAASTVSGTETPPATQTLSTDHDRITQFTYDTIGRRLTETRLDVDVFNSSTGGVTGADAQIVYTYNALGQVLSKQEASGDQISYTYDDAGRLRREQRSAFVDYTGASVTPTVDYEYNGLGDLLLTRARGGNGSTTTASDQRVTTYEYGAGGRLYRVTDAADYVRTYRYDAAGRVTREEYNRFATGTGAGGEAIGYKYDFEGRILERGVILYDGGWSSDVADGVATTNMQYNAFGEISARGMNGVFAEAYEYDAAGRLVKTNAGDGVWKYFVYDEAGNQTVMIATVGKDFGHADFDTLDEVLALWDDPGITGPDYDRIATHNVTGVVATVTKYDGRNQAIEVLEPQRQLNATTSANLTTTRAYNAFGEVSYEINAAGARFDYSYNTMGRRIKTESPSVEARGENGRWITGYDSSTFAPLATATGATTFRPVEHAYYDVSGRLVAQRDANGNLTKYDYLAGTGYGGSEGLVSQVTAADGGVTRTKYDIHGDARRIEDPLYNSGVSTTAHSTVQSFDAMGRLLSMDRSNVLTDYYAYDGLGQRTKHWNSFWNSTGSPTTNVEETTYDHQGRITQVIAPGGDKTKYAYVWDGALVTAGMNTSSNPYGGWVKTTTFAHGKTLTEKTDAFGRAISKIDMSNYTTNYTYDKAGRLTQRSATQPGGSTAWGHVLYQSYFNTGRLGEIYQLTDNHLYVPAGGAGGVYGGTLIYENFTATYRGSTFGYDAVGNVTAQTLSEAVTYNWATAETYIEWDMFWAPGESGTTYLGGVKSSQTATYDALGRLISWTEAGSSEVYPSGPGAFNHQRISPSSLSLVYDANGNIRRSYATHRTLDAYGNISTTNSTQEYWYRYDAMNRMATARGQFTGDIFAGTGAVGRGATGVDTFYNYDGTRAYTLTAVGGNWRDDYTYNALGLITEVRGGSNLSAAGGIRGVFTYDAMSRLLTQTDYNGTTGYIGGGATYTRAVTYNAKNQITEDETYLHQSDDIYRTLSAYSYGVINYNGDGSVNTTTTTYALGSVLQIDAQNWKDGAGRPTTRTTNVYNWHDGAVHASIAYDADTGNSSNAIWNTTYTYDVVGGQKLLESAYIADGRPRDVFWINDMTGQVIRRSERDGLAGSDPHEIWHRMSGRQMGYVGNNGSYDVSYAHSVQLRQTPGGATGSFADFDLAYDHINSYEQGGRGGLYTVRSGDTLQSIAANLWGDANLWYKLAEVNGLASDATLVEGHPLLIPSGVQRNEHNADTYKPYDPLEVLGNTSPTSPKPVNGPKCGGLATVIMVVIAVVVSIYTAGAAAGAFGAIANGATAGGVLSGAAAGGAAAFGGGLGAAVVAGGGAGTFLTTIGAVAAGAIGGAAGSIASQAFGVATGIQDKFSWNAVALAAVGGGVGAGVSASPTISGALKAVSGGNAAVQAGLTGALSSAITQGIGVATGLQDKFSWAGVAAAGVGAAVGARIGGDSFGATMVRSGAQLVADAATRSLIEGTDFGDNIMAALPNAIASIVAGGMTGRGSSTTGSAKVGSTPKNAKEVIQAECEGAWQAAFDHFADRPTKQVGEISKTFPVLDDEEIVVVGERNAFLRWADRMGFDGSRGYDGPSGRNFTWDGIFRAHQRDDVSFSDWAGAYGSAIYHAPGDAWDGFVGALNAPLYTERHANMFENIARNNEPLPTYGEFMGTVAGELTGINSLGRAYDHNHDVLDNLQSGDLVGARHSAQGAMFEGTMGATVFLGEVNAVRAGVAEARATNALRPHTAPPDVFANLFPEDIPRPANIIPNDRLMTMNQRNLAYVVLDDGQLVVGKNNMLQGHIDLAGGQPVLAAGEFGVLNGELRFIDNFSGHYRPFGPSAQFQAENAFQRLGFDIRGKYVERSFD